MLVRELDSVLLDERVSTKAPGGVLADESFVLSQAYYFGSIEDKSPITVLISSGRRVDLCEDLDLGARYQHGSPEPPKPKPPRTAPAGLRENDDNPVLLAEGRRRVAIHVAKHGLGEDPRGTRAYSLASWLADMRTSDGKILSADGIIGLMQAAEYGDIAEDILDRRQSARGCELVLSLAEKLGPLLGEAL